MKGSAQLQICARCLTPPSSAKGVYAVTVHGWARSKADSNVALEPEVVATRELEGIEACHQHLVLRIILPVVKNGPVRGTAIGICHLILRLFFIVHGLGNAATCKATIDFMWLNCDLEQQVISNLSTAYFFAIHSADLHLARGRWASVGNCARRGYHADIESQRHSLLASVVDTLDVVSASTVCDQFGMFLDDEHERGLSIDVHQAAGVEEHLEVDRLTLAAAHQTATLGILAVALHVDDTIEAVQLN